MTELTSKNWNDLVNNVGNIADKTQRQLIEVQAYLNSINNTLKITNIILGVIAVTFIVSTISRLFKGKKGEDR
ncbi:hypothetical protein [Terrihalobacillus insolitus]|uniref:hypothetical protein n=1 Tax=Terrihalobacillus insolitus TaxID=2950438 RepID=UPI00234020B7|nr:hypothetical protein [Terrihalobacillus insolitus]MDC3414505.1 hypothetical protein [Terrihalobacillus insolitus]